MNQLSSSRSPIDPSQFLRNLQNKINLVTRDFVLHQQQDVTEVLQILLPEIVGTSLFARDMISVTVKTTTCCSDCFFSADKEEKEDIIPLDCCGTIEQSITSFFTTKLLEGTNKWDFLVCGTKTDSTRDSVFTNLGDILFLQMKRFKFSSGQAVKDTTQLDLSPFTVKIPVSTEFGVSFHRQFNLVATINHSGNLNSGHYWSNILHPVSKQWLNCNDRHVKSINSSVLNGNSSYVLIFKSI